ncbi:uncharacterized protein MELLADRAFT_87196 [Melampsora larici-populina 98AG31]|uniref:Helicase C-terminal domain-containing protein n=1 Tax=Melampsora larici-populina (strain 98AG31 / pathotype 3-4-7) TaxID=747676 RepID=F4R4V3_MELLP|nr:uncharacterized protein MELLADRAFT_87196 [Melampsora larici-populina 98AG31]EGG12934.1 hypothetical protein MELLADRAFT_87196 [Melampsora larici-populina 98AG31]
MMLRFLHVTPFYKNSVWDTHIAQPVQRGNLAPVSRLLRYIMLRRTKDSHIFDLPPINHTTIILDMHKEVKDVYQTLYQNFLRQFGVERKQKFQGGEFFKQLTNLRMTCNHPLLFRQNEQGVDAENQPINLIEQKLGIKLPDERIHNSKVRDAIPTDWKLSPKIAYLVHMLQKKKSHGGGKSVIYTQWKSFIDWIIMAFDNSGITYRQLHGDQSTFERTSQLNSFTKDPNVEAFVVSIEAGGVGLNMTCADEVYLMDAHWNPQVVQQAVDRLHRIGQAKSVRVFHVVTGQSIEQHLYNVQKRKAALAKRVITLTVPTEELEKAEALRVEEFPTGDVSDLGDPNQCYRN